MSVPELPELSIILAIAGALTSCTKFVQISVNLTCGIFDKRDKIFQSPLCLVELDGSSRLMEHKYVRD